MAENQITQVVTVSVALETAALSPATFGRMCILGPNAAADTVYTSLAGMISDGFATTDQEYIEAASALAQSSETGRRVTDWLVGRRSATVAQVDTLTCVYDAAGTYTVTLAGKGIATTVIGPVSAVTDSDGTATAIAAAINGSAFAPRVTALASGGSSGALTVTSDQAGIPFTCTVSVAGGSATFVRAATTANNGITEDLNALVAAGLTWYATVPCSRDARELVEAAAWHESATPSKIMLGQHSQSASLTGAYDAGSPYADLPSELKALGYNRSGLLYHGTDSAGAAAAWAGARLPFDPGSQTWSLKTLVGITADALTSSQVGVLTGTAALPQSGKNCNVYIPLNDSTSRVLRGMMASGRRIDEQRTIDMLQNGLETVVANLLLARGKVPFNNAGISEIVGVMQAYLASKQDGANAALDPEVPIQFTVPAASSISSTDKTNRILSGITATGRLSGAIESVTFALTVTN